MIFRMLFGLIFLLSFEALVNTEKSALYVNGNAQDVTVKVTPQNYSASPGEDVTFVCETTTVSPLSVTWSYHNLTLTNGASPTKITYNCTVLNGRNGYVSYTAVRSDDGRRCDLTIKNVNVNQAGEYTCQENTPSPTLDKAILFIPDQKASNHQVISSHNDGVTSSSWPLHRLPGTFVCVIILLSL